MVVVPIMNEQFEVVDPWSGGVLFSMHSKLSTENLDFKFFLSWWGITDRVRDSIFVEKGTIFV